MSSTPLDPVASERLSHADKVFTSDLSINEFALLHGAGFEPLDLVMGVSVYHVGYQFTGIRQQSELPVLTEATYRARWNAMARMQAEIARKPDAGLLWQKNFISGRITLLVQYWESGEKLFAYAHDRAGGHFPAWSDFNRKAKDNHAVGIWHETYLLKPEDCENIYRDMPAFGLGGAIGLTPATARRGGLRDPFPGS